MNEHWPYPVIVYLGDLDENGHPDLESEEIGMEIRCGCTRTLRYHYGHEAESASQETT